MMEKSGISGFVQGSIQYRKIVGMIVFFLVAVGIFALANMNKDEFPTFEIKEGLVAAVYPGASVHQVQNEVAKPLEEFLFSFSEVDRANTKLVSRDGACFVYVALTTPASKKDEVWSKLKLRINAFKPSLPPGVLALVVMDDFSAISTILIAMESEDKGNSEMMEYARKLSERLRAIPELANVKIQGEMQEELAVIIDQEKLASYNISPSSLLLEYQTSTLISPGANFSTDYTNSPVRLSRTVSNEEELRNQIIYSSEDGNILRLRDVATVERRFAEPSSIVKYNGNSALVLSLEMRPDNNIVAFGDDVEKVLQDFMATAPESLKISRISDQPKVVHHSVWSFLRDLLISMLVVIFVMLMLFPMKSALIASSGVPVCTAVALALMYCFGICLNTVSLAALIVCLGMIVDDSVITMDGYMDKLKLNVSRTDAACRSARELFMPMFMATFAISAMFFPLKAIITGYLGDFVANFPWVIAFSLMVSLAYAVCVVPSLEVRFINSGLPEKKNLIARMQDRLFAVLQNAYDKAQTFCFRRPALTILAAFSAIALGLFMFSSLNVQMMPMAVRPYFAVEIYLEPSANIRRTEEISDSLSGILRRDPRVESVTEFIGTGAPRFHCTYAPILPSPRNAQLIVNTKDSKATEAVLAEYEHIYENYFPEAQIHFKQMDYQGTSTPLAAHVYGDSYEDILAVSDALKCFMQKLADENLVKWVHSDADNYLSSVEISLDRDESARLGVNRTLLNLSLASIVNGSKLATIQDGETSIPVKLYNSDFDRNSSYNDISNVTVNSSIPGISVPLRQVAGISPQWEPFNLVRQNGRQCVVVGADMRFGKSQPVAAAKLKEYISTLDLPEGVSIELGGLNSANSHVIPEIGLSFLAAVMVLFMFLVFHFKKISLAVLTIVLSSLCLFGAFFGLWIFGLDFSMTAVLGLVSLVGIIVRNGIIMFEYAEELKNIHGYSVKQAAEEAGKRRMRPIFLTSCTTALGVIPMIISGDSLWMPLGVVICFGTMLSVVLITLVMPVSYWLVYRIRERKSNTDVAGRGAVCILLICFGLFSAENSFAQSTSASQNNSIKLTLEDCLRMAENSNPQVKNAVLDLRSAHYLRQEAMSEYFPKISLSVNGFWSVNPLLEIDAKDIIGDNENYYNLKPYIDTYAAMYGFEPSFSMFKRGYSFSVMALQPVYVGGKIVNGNRLASIALTAAELKKDIELRKSQSETESQWWKIAALEEKISMMDDLELNLDKLQSTVSSAIAAGLISESESLQVELRKSQLKALKKQAQSGLRLLKMQLFNSIGQECSLTKALASDEKPYVDDILLDCSMPLPLNPEAYWKETAAILAEMDENKLLDLQIQAKKLEKKMTMADALPQIAVGASYAYSDLTGGGKSNALVLATLKIPVSDWGKVSRRMQRADIEIQKASNDRDYLNNQLELLISKRWLDMVSAYEQWQISIEAYEMASRLYEIARADFASGLIPVQDLLQSETSYRQARSEEYDALSAYREAISLYKELR